MTARERLQAARQAMLERRYEDALRDLVWFHDHALEECPAMYGVRLSYALFDWVKLGALYPPARQALEAQRLHALAIDLIHSPSLRAEVRTAIARRDDLPRLYRRGWARAGRKPGRRPRPRLAK